MALTGAERQLAFRKQKLQEGLVPVTCYVPAGLAAAFMDAARLLCAERGLELGPLRDTRTGKLVRRTI